MLSTTHSSGRKFPSVVVPQEESKFSYRSRNTGDSRNEKFSNSLYIVCISDVQNSYVTLLKSVYLWNDIHVKSNSLSCKRHGVFQEKMKNVS